MKQNNSSLTVPAAIEVLRIVNNKEDIDNKLQKLVEYMRKAIGEFKFNSGEQDPISTQAKAPDVVNNNQMDHDLDDYFNNKVKKLDLDSFLKQSQELQDPEVLKSSQADSDFIKPQLPKHTEQLPLPP